jgi:hypothetical protein
VEIRMNNTEQKIEEILKNNYYMEYITELAKEYLSQSTNGGKIE